MERRRDMSGQAWRGPARPFPTSTLVKRQDARHINGTSSWTLQNPAGSIQQAHNISYQRDTRVTGTSLGRYICNKFTQISVMLVGTPLRIECKAVWVESNMDVRQRSKKER